MNSDWDSELMQLQLVKIWSIRTLWYPSWRLAFLVGYEMCFSGCGPSASEATSTVACSSLQCWWSWRLLPLLSCDRECSSWVLPTRCECCWREVYPWWKQRSDTFSLFYRESGAGLKRSLSEEVVIVWLAVLFLPEVQLSWYLFRCFLIVGQTFLLRRTRSGPSAVITLNQLFFWLTISINSSTLGSLLIPSLTMPSGKIRRQYFSGTHYKGWSFV